MSVYIARYKTDETTEGDRAYAHHSLIDTMERREWGVERVDAIYAARHADVAPEIVAYVYDESDEDAAWTNQPTERSTMNTSDAERRATEELIEDAVGTDAVTWPSQRRAEIALAQCQYIAYDELVKLEAAMNHRAGTLTLRDLRQRAYTALNALRQINAVAESGEATPDFVAMLAADDARAS